MKKKSLSAKKKIHNSILKHLSNKKILKVFEEFKNSSNINNKFAVAISGGPDSLSLAFLSKCLSIINKKKAKFYIVNHNLRKGSLLEAKLVTSKLKKFGINCKILNWHGKKPTKNIQSIARNARYNILRKECKKNKINQILIGHQIDDVYENFILRLLRGSGLKGLTSFDKVSKYKINDIEILRPLINVEKKDLIFLSKKVFNFFVNDPSNLNENFKRIRVRNLLEKLEKEGLDKAKLKLTINNLKDTNDAINFYVNQNIYKNSKFIKDKNIFILNQNFFKQPHEIVFRAFSALLNLISKKYYPPRGKKIDDLIQKIKFKKINKKTTLGGCFIEKINKTVLISREKSYES